jgi:predicted metalloprotease with PDZ domain
MKRLPITISILTPPESSYTFQGDKAEPNFGQLGENMKILKCWMANILWFFSLTAMVQAQQPARSYPGTITISVDASEAPRKLFHARMTIPATPGPLVLLYPKWIPGEHGPTGPINGLTGLKMTAGGKDLRWRRDDVNTYAFHVIVPDGVKEIEVAADYASPAEEGGFTAGTTASAHLMVLSWNWVLLYPQGYAADQIPCKASLRLPAGWQSGSALPVEKRSGNSVDYRIASLYTLIDSPVIAGEFFSVVPLTPAGVKPAVEMDIASDSLPALQMSPELAQHFKQLIRETTGLFGATHYRDYHFVFSLSDHIAHFGLEHHESNDSRARERSLIDPQLTLQMASLLPHEYVHSWNGKYRRPAGLTTPDYSQPMKGELLWVYEGLTDYLGEILTARSGLRTPEQFRDELALTAAQMAYRSGRTWRPLIDTTIDAQDLYNASKNWSNWRRGVDFYSEGDLIWLDADMTIRKLTGGKKSLDDFCKLFAGPPSLDLDSIPAPRPYDFNELIYLLNQVAPYDWRKFWEDRLWTTSPAAPLAGIEDSGWKLTFDETPSEYVKAKETTDKSMDLTFSLGITLDSSHGTIQDVAMDSAASKAMIGPGMKLIAVNGRAWNPDVLRDALSAGKTSGEPLQLLIENAEFFKTYAVDYHGGNRYPHLVKGTGADVLSEITRPHAEVR